MIVGDAFGSTAGKPVVCASDIEELYRRRKERGPGSTELDEAMQKVEETKHAAAQTTLDMMDRHNEMVKKSQELAKAQAKKRALEQMAQKHIEEYREILAEMAIRNAERHDILEAARLKKL